MDNNRVSYIVDEKNGICVAEINNCSFDAERMVNERFIPCVTSKIQISNDFFTSKYNMNRKYKAVAKLHPEDKWDEKRGIKIANDKLTELYHASLNKHLSKYADDFRRIADNIDKYLEDRHFQRNN